MKRINMHLIKENEFSDIVNSQQDHVINIWDYNLHIRFHPDFDATNYYYLANKVLEWKAKGLSYGTDICVFDNPPKLGAIIQYGIMPD